ncbi:MAG TPA: hypothetical protein VEK79_11850 [Thermoanaerobaculia bacterium]|nr:hypothetical protein [Thermoanaerobaculia bacterium]
MHPAHNIQKLIDALVARAADDARAFRKQYPNDAPTERWIENSYTAALPLAKAAAELDPGTGPHPHLFSAYRGEINRILGERVERRDGGDGLTQMPTPGEHA